MQEQKPTKKPKDPPTVLDVINGLRKKIHKAHQACPDDLKPAFPVKLREYADVLAKGELLDW